MAALPVTRTDAERNLDGDHQPHRSKRTNYTAELRLVPKRRRTAGLAVAFALVLVGMMLGAAMLHIRLAERQIQLDELDRQVEAAHSRFEVMRGQRAELRSPGHLSDQAMALGMNPAPTTGYIEMDRWALARAIAVGGRTGADGSAVAAEDDPLAQYRAIKRGGSGQR